MLTAFRFWVMLKFQCNDMNSLGGRSAAMLGNELERSRWRLGLTNWITAYSTTEARC